MVKRLGFLLGLVMLVSVLYSCSGGSGGPAATTSATQGPATLGTAFTLTPGKSIHIASENMDVTFVGVDQDSRCPAGEMCIQSGRVMFDITVNYKGKPYPITLIEEGANKETLGYVFYEYTITHVVTPYPEEGKDIANGDYKVALTFSKTAN